MSRQLGGGLLDSPVTYEFGDGFIRVGSWLNHGLRSYSGALRMWQIITIKPGVHDITLDLGHVRGTVECFVNSVSAGVRFLSPYRFDLSSHVTAGQNRLELLVTNTLANHLSTWSPTRSWSPDQLECGILGPVTLTTGSSPD